MDKEKTDNIITEYMKKIYGFAVSKTMSIDSAEELASRITFEVYTSLLKAENVHNIDGYIYRISNNIYSRFIAEEKSEKSFIYSESVNHPKNSPNRDDAYERIRNEIAFLSSLQREIIVLYYYKKLKTKDIAEQLNISQANVKRHLYEAKNKIKDGFSEKQKREINPQRILFTNMKFLGKFNVYEIDMPFYFSKKLPQNIVYNAYHKPKTAIDIAKELSIPTPFVEDEIKKLLDNGFVKKLPGNKYLANICMLEKIQERDERINKVYKKYAKIVCELYVPLLMDNGKWKMDNETPPNSQTHLSLDSCLLSNSIYIPEKDYNFFLWSIISFACWKKLKIEENENDIAKLMTKRKDSRENLAITTIENDLSYKTEFVNEYNDVLRYSVLEKVYPIKAWLFYSHYDEKNKTNKIWDYMLFETLYDFMTGKISKTYELIDKFVRLFENGFLVSKKDTDYVNMVVTTLAYEDFKDLFPAMPEKLIDIGKKLDDTLYKINKKYFPNHMQDICRYLNKNSLSSGQMRVHIIEYLLKKGVLKPLKKNQKQTVNMILFSDVLPG